MISDFSTVGSAAVGTASAKGGGSDAPSPTPRKHECDCDTRRRCVDSRQKDGYRWRRYECPSCSKRWSSVEIVLGDVGKGPMTAGDYLHAIRRQIGGLR